MQTPVSSTESAAQRSPTRRALLVSALGGIGAAIVGAIGHASPTLAADGDPMVVGGEYTATSVTKITNTSNPSSVIWGNSDSGAGIWGTSNSYYGVIGGSNSPTHAAVVGKSEPAGNSTGVLGCSGVIPAAKPKTGVYGFANQDSGSRGVYGYSGKGHGVHGQAWGGVGVYATAQPKGYALRTKGRIQADQVSGVATIAVGNVSVLVSPGVNVTASSFVLLTPQADIGSRGLWYTTNPAADNITIHISSSRSSATKIAWLMLG